MIFSWAFSDAYTFDSALLFSIFNVLFNFNGVFGMCLPVGSLAATSLPRQLRSTPTRALVSTVISTPSPKPSGEI
jgi:hypothetical protein